MNKLHSPVILLLAGLLSGCAINGVGIGFSLDETQNLYSQRRSIKGFGVHLDTSASHGGLTIGALSTELICPKAQPSHHLLTQAPAASPWQVAAFQPEICQKAQISHRSLYGLALDINPYALRLVVGLNQQHLIRVKPGESLTLWYDNKKTNPGEIRLYTPLTGVI